MEDPEFRAQMEIYTKSPEFENAMKMAQAQMEGLQSDPAKMAEIQAEIGGLLS